MCYHISLLQNKWDRLEKRYSKKKSQEFPDPDEPGFCISAFDHPKVSIVNAAGLHLASWGLIPQWCKSLSDAHSIRAKTLNAMSETAALKPSFRDAFRHGRCIIPVSGFFEWHQFAGQKYPVYVSLKTQDIFSLAGISSEWTNPESGEKQLTFSILTREASRSMSIIHNTKRRMPLILSADSEEKWLAGVSTFDLSCKVTFPSDPPIEAYTVSRKINSIHGRRNSPDSIGKFHYPELVFSELIEIIGLHSK
jgi:putative SOS response-associated peptidase YedK